MLSPCSILSNNISIVSTLRKMLEKQVESREVENTISKSSTLSRLTTLRKESSQIKSELDGLRDYVKRTTFEALIPEQFKHLMKPEIKDRGNRYEASFDDKENRVHNLQIKVSEAKCVPPVSKENHTLRTRIYKDLEDLKKIQEKEKVIRNSLQPRPKRKGNTEYKRRPLEEILGISETRSVNHSPQNSRDQTFVTEESLESHIIESIVTPLENSNITVPSLMKSNASQALICGCRHQYYSGDLLNDKPHGKGRLYACCEKATIKLSQGAEFYSGGFRNGKMDGYGTLTFKNGTKFVGMFKDGVRHGDGSIYYKGSVQMGKWSHGKLSNKI